MAEIYPTQPIDPRTGRPLGDHGTAIDAINWALDTEVTVNGECDSFLRSWREGGAFEEFPEFYAWLKKEGR